MALTLDTPIPTDARPAVRAYIKSQPDFADWLLGLYESREVLNRMLIQYALEKGHGAFVEGIIYGAENRRGKL